MNKLLRNWRSILVQALLLVVILFAVHLYQTRNTVAGPAPELAGIDLDNQLLSLQAYTDEPVLVHFWATWCPVCRLELGSIHALAKEYAVITVAMENTARADIVKYMQEQQVDFSVLPDPSGELAERYGVQAVPTSFIVDSRGMVRSTTVGYTTEVGLRLRLWLATLLD